jgi:Mg2+ and Co2+ transporter CorA
MINDTLSQAYSNFMGKISVKMSKISLEHAMSSKRTDGLMNRISIFIALLFPASLFSSIWGMNVPGIHYFIT